MLHIFGQGKRITRQVERWKFNYIQLRLHKDAPKPLSFILFSAYTDATLQLDLCTPAIRWDNPLL